MTRKSKKTVLQARYNGSKVQKGVSARAAHALYGLSRQVSACRLSQACNLEGMSMNIQRKNSAYHFRMQSERVQTLVQSCDKIIMIYNTDLTTWLSLLKSSSSGLPVAGQVILQVNMHR